MQVLVDDLGEDVETASGGVDGEHQGLCRAEDQHAAEQVEPRVAHHGIGRAGVDAHVDQIVVRRGQVLPRINPLTDLGHGTENQGAVDRLQAELLADKQIGQNQQDSIDDGDHHRQADVDAYALEDIGQHDGETRDRAHDQLAGNEKIIDANARHKHAESHNQQLHPELLAGQSLPDFLHYVIKLTHNIMIYS